GGGADPRRRLDADRDGPPARSRPVGDLCWRAAGVRGHQPDRPRARIEEVMSLRIYDTRAKRKIDWAPPPGRQIGFYACGITPYDLCHVGHARFLVAFDIIVRHLRSSGLDVRFVRNVT